MKGLICDNLTRGSLPGDPGKVLKGERMNLKLLMKIQIMLAIVSFLAALPAGAAETGKQPVLLSLAADVLTDSISLSGVGIPKSAFKEASGIAIFPNIVKFDLSSGDRQAEGVVLVRTQSGEWSGPAFVKLAVGNAANWSGAGARDIIFIFRTEKPLENMRNGELSIGRSEKTEEPSDFVAYKRSGTVFKEFQVREANILFDTEASAKYYGVNQISPDDIFSGNVPGQPLNGNPLTCLMAAFSGTTQVCLIS